MSFSQAKQSSTTVISLEGALKENGVRQAARVTLSPLNLFTFSTHRHRGIKSKISGFSLYLIAFYTWVEKLCGEMVILFNCNRLIAEFSSS